MTSSFAVITPSYRPDATLFAELHQSVLRYTEHDTVHYVIVPDQDRALFAQYEGPRCRVWPVSEVLTRRYLRLPRDLWLYPKRPWPPVRGWVRQQAIKIAATGLLDADAVLIADSDVVLVRPVDAQRCTVDGQLGMYRHDGAMHAGMPRHLRWHHVARQLLGLPAAPPQSPLPDYVSPLNVWSPATVRAMQRRITEVTGRNWMDAFTAQLHVSEFVLYGTFVDEVFTAPSQRPALDLSFCHNYWDTVPLDYAGALSFADELPPAAIGMMISSKSYTPMDVRLAAVRRTDLMVAQSQAVGV
jgi:Family of unknown function (DUF6492)